MTVVRRRASGADEKWGDNDFLHAPSGTDLPPLGVTAASKGGEG